MITLFNYLLVFNIFSSGFVLFSSPVEFYLGYVFIVLFLIFYGWNFPTIGINSNFLIIMIILSASSLINVCGGNNTFFLVAKQVFGILITGSAYYLLMKVNKFDVDKLFKIYLRIALIVSMIGIFQEFSFLIGFKNGYDYSWLLQKCYFTPTTGGLLRVNSIFVEPSHFAISMAPAFFVALLNIFRKKSAFLHLRLANLIVVISYFLTFSIIAYIVALISPFLFPFANKKRYFSIILILGVFFSLGAYFFLPEIKSRVDDTIKVAIGSAKTTKSHLTVYAYHSNGFVAFKSFADSPFFGHGLGSHPVSYDQFIRPDADTADIFWAKGYTGINKNDSNSLFLRLVSETGLFGLVVAFYFLYHFRVKDIERKDLYILNNAVLLLFIAQLLRQGHYFANGLFFFVWLYYFSSKIDRRSFFKSVQEKNE